MGQLAAIGHRSLCRFFLRFFLRFLWFRCQQRSAFLDGVDFVNRLQGCRVGLVIHRIRSVPVIQYFRPQKGEGAHAVRCPHLSSVAPASPVSQCCVGLGTEPGAPGLRLPAWPSQEQTELLWVYVAGHAANGLTPVVVVCGRCGLSHLLFQAWSWLFRARAGDEEEWQGARMWGSCLFYSSDLLVLITVLVYGIGCFRVNSAFVLRACCVHHAPS